MQQFGAAYDDARGLPRYQKSKHFNDIQTFFGRQCCYCGRDFTDVKAVQDHLVPLNQSELGLHAWGNIVPACSSCNALKQGRPWHQIIAQQAGTRAAERYQRVEQFVQEYRYEPPFDLRNATADLYAEVGSVAMALIQTKIERTKQVT